MDAEDEAWVCEDGCGCDCDCDCRRWRMGSCCLSLSLFGPSCSAGLWLSDLGFCAVLFALPSCPPLTPLTSSADPGGPVAPVPPFAWARLAAFSAFLSSFFFALDGCVSLGGACGRVCGCCEASEGLGACVDWEEGLLGVPFISWPVFDTVEGLEGDLGGFCSAILDEGVADDV